MVMIWLLSIRQMMESQPGILLALELKMVELLNIDCMEFMKTVPDNFFDLAIVYVAERFCCVEDKVDLFD